MSSFSKARNVRIKSLTPGAVVQLRFGKAAVRSEHDVIVEAKLIEHGAEGEKLLAVFEELGAEVGDDGQTKKTVVSHFPHAPWRSENLYVSLVGVDQSTFTSTKPTNPIQTEVIGEAIKLIEAEKDDVFASDQLIALLNEIMNGKRVGTSIKTQAVQLANKLVEELKSLPDNNVQD